MANPATLALAAGVPLALVLFLGFFLLSPLAAVVFALVAWVVVGVSVWRLASQVVLRLVGGVAPDLTAVGPARLDSLVTSVSAAAGVPRPALLVVDDPAPNALVTGRTAREATLVVTSGLLDRLDRLQLESVVAHQLALVRAGETHGRDTSVLVLGLPATRFRSFRGLARTALFDGERRTLALDATAVGVTRYPPALLQALGIAAAQPPVGGHPALGPLWWFPADRRDLDVRLDHVRELT